jgi:hypothetical protein
MSLDRRCEGCRDCCWKAVAIAFPRPREAPVTRARRRPSRKSIWTVVSVAVSERLDPDNYTVFEPNALHQLMGAEIVGPQFYLDFNR